MNPSGATCIALAFALLAGCGGGDRLSGTGSQTGNSIVSGRILLSDSVSPAVGVPVHLRPESWTSGDTASEGAIQSVSTDTAGRYLFSGVPRGRYRVEALAQARGWTRTLDARVGSATAPTGELRALGGIAVEFDPTDTVLGGQLQIYGLDRSLDIPVHLHREIVLRFDSIPPGLHTVRVRRGGRVVCDAPVRVLPGVVDTLDYEEIDLPPGGPRDDD